MHVDSLICSPRGISAGHELKYIYLKIDVLIDFLFIYEYIMEYVSINEHDFFFVQKVYGVKKYNFTLKHDFLDFIGNTRQIIK